MSLLVGEVDRLLLDQLVHLRIILRACVEGWEAHDHLVSENAERPPINREGVTTFDEDLRSQIVWCTAEGVRHLVAFEDLGEAEVRQTDVAILVHQDVLRLQVTVDDVLRVQMAESHGDLDGVEAGPILWEPSHLPQVHKKLTTTDESHNEEDFLLSLEDVAHTDKEGVVCLQQDVLLEPGRLHLIVLDNHVLP